MKKPVIYCDFDGTVTEKDNIISIMKAFAPPEWEPIKDQILSGQISIRKGVGELFSLLSSSDKERIAEFVIGQAKIREGFGEFVAYAREEGIPLYIVSGGIDFFVLPLLSQYGPFDGVFCNTSDFSGETIEIHWPNSCDENCGNDCGCCKPSVIRRLGHGRDYFKIVIGDSVTDLEAAKQADFVLARDLLLEKCGEWELPHDSFNNFYDCIASIKKRTEVKERAC
ncbi:2-hydroxy-3-keto-5-methylthiopentenyl-1-phosphate phosphatase [Neobacillus piezotolerans]|uniref:2-hydroxy-3-keto-5-methylthiopentenyl-1-phosphate phosphatase n=1 Tax=Neobacillus piezotolerans TaxID=2259171 RepID=A0A3D8GVI2_9BACI|nr:2-hydroxy-3-keto-5-methylthiopentenyl-1-phosphate phosphatase [Neobacillus piezotolerans]RDU38372.1 2-hydroxy-3-keto-5-methylthiopentenyl-1-phosphate phosphatase [Neobacillus piezotolerans]